MSDPNLSVAREVVQNLKEVRETAEWLHQSSLHLQTSRLSADMADEIVTLYSGPLDDQEAFEKPLHPMAVEAGEMLYTWYKDRYPRRRKITLERCMEEEDFNQWFTEKSNKYKKFGRDVAAREENLIENLKGLAPVVASEVDTGEHLDAQEVALIANKRHKTGRHQVRVALRCHEIERFGIDVHVEEEKASQDGRILSSKIYVRCHPEDVEIIKHLPSLSRTDFLQWCADYEGHVDPIDYRPLLRFDLTEDELDSYGLPKDKLNTYHEKRQSGRRKV